jgi:hypothetical protein
MDGGGACAISIVRVEHGTRNEIPSGFDDLVAAPTLQLTVEARVSGLPVEAGAPRWTWHVEPRGGAPSTSTPGGADAGLIDPTQYGDVIDVNVGPGSYQIIVSNDVPGCAQASTVIDVAAPAPPRLRFRVTPPAAAQVPAREIEIDGANPSSVGELPLCELGKAMLTIAPKNGRNALMPAYVRITTPSLGSGIEGYTGQGPLLEALATNLSYRVLVIPGTAIAPFVVTGTPIDLRTALSANWSAGVPVTGTARDGDGNPVAGARVLLRDGDRPSTIGVSAADGSFSLATREATLSRDGTLAADILAPTGSGLPDAHVGSPGILLPAGTASVSLSMTWAKIPSATASVSVVDGEGAPVAGARVRAELSGAPPVIGALAVHSSSATLNDVTLQATGTVWAQVTTDDAGVAQLGRLPVGGYRVTVAPPAGLASAAITGADFVLGSAGLATRVALEAPVAFEGRLTPAALAAHAKVTALDRGTLAAAVVPSATVDEGGRYSLPLAGGRTYELIVEAPAGQPFARRAYATVSPDDAASGSRMDSMLAPRPWSGSVTCAGSGVGGALVQVFCAGASCIDPTLVLAQGTTRSDGTVVLMLPGVATEP